jgi:hypothetical protein
MSRRTERSHRLVALGIAAAAVAISSFPVSGMSAVADTEHEHTGIAGSKADAANYTAEIAAAGAYKAGAEGTVQVTVVPKGGYHINPQYPYKFKANAPGDGLTYPKPMLQRSDGKFEETRGTFNVPFIAAKAGKTTVGGTLNLSVCSAANCVVDKVPLELVVEVK